MTRRKRVERETDEFLEAVNRMIRRAGVRTAEADEIELRQLVAMRDTLEAAIVTAVRGQHARRGSWAYIGMALGIKRQTAQERYAVREKVIA
ncbi:hypothetical protein SAMN04487788_1953 [Microbacterium testaceum StLB037]|uniref:Uncharacterized protein n=1 Tax=Microbacterium testaceum (strain StLB037) TaxID=979556 RepID=A0A1H0PSB7_MICTS|nr:hypothetical protein [Microbacterium testaceum]SDP07449.1 hypothetical protein SAMN04487788_1953 [Microbacterium testaceum StLB037]